MRSPVTESLRENGIKLVGWGGVVPNDLSSLRSGKQILICQESSIVSMGKLSLALWLKK